MAELIFCSFLSLFFSIMMVAGWVTTEVYLGDESVRVYPCILLAVISVCLVLHCVSLYRHLPKEEKRKGLLQIFGLCEANTQRLLLSIVATILYIYLLDILGFVILTPLITIWYMYTLGERNWGRLILISLLLTAVVYSIFIYGLQIRFPRGRGVFRKFSLMMEYLFR